MAKIKYEDNLIGMKCSQCKRRNYYTHRNKKKVTRKITLTKFCPWCRTHTEHGEVKLRSK
jgi:large subunit ribosomal protein L33